jgi:hypothetical protein
MAGASAPARTLDHGASTAVRQGGGASLAGGADPRRAAAAVKGRLPEVETCRGMHALCDAVSHLAKVRDAVVGTHLHARMETALRHLTQAAATVPDELFALMLINSHVGYDELSERLRAAIQEGA